MNSAINAEYFLNQLNITYQHELTLTFLANLNQMSIMANVFCTQNGSSKSP